MLRNPCSWKEKNRILKHICNSSDKPRQNHLTCVHHLSVMKAHHRKSDAVREAAAVLYLCQYVEDFKLIWVVWLQCPFTSTYEKPTSQILSCLKVKVCGCRAFDTNKITSDLWPETLGWQVIVLYCGGKLQTVSLNAFKMKTQAAASWQLPSLRAPLCQCGNTERFSYVLRIKVQI